MGKKKHKKLKRKHQHSGYIAPKPAPIAAVSSAAEMDVTPELEEKIIEKIEEETPAETGYNDPMYKDEKKVVTQILLIILFLVLILIGVYFLNQKTTILSSFGDYLYRILNIQTQ